MLDLDPALAPAIASLVAILAVPEALNDRAPAAVAYRAAIRRQGRALGELGGAKAMHFAIQHVAEMAPERSGRREAVMASAWEGLPGWSDALVL